MTIRDVHPRYLVNSEDDTPVSSTNPLPVTASFLESDLFFSISSGLVAGYSSVIKFGENLDVDTVEEDLWSPGGVLTYLTTADTFRIAAGGNAADTAAGVGAQEVIFKFLDADRLEVTETIATAGASASASTASTGLRFHSAYIGDCGTSETNVGAITIEAVSAGTTQGLIPATDGQTQQLHFTVPAGKTGYVVGNRFSIVKSGGGGPGGGSAGVRIKGFVRLYSATSNNNLQGWRKISNINIIESGGNPMVAEEFLSDPIPEKSDIKVTVISDTSNMQIDGRLYIVLKDN